jgi:cupin superfamily acireductone dioxygenase involved in methionine salvage
MYKTTIKKGHGVEIVKDSKDNIPVATKEFVKGSFHAVLKLHEQVINSKNDTISILKEENVFLKKALISVQDQHEEDKETIRMLSRQIKHLEEELAFTKKKYRLMWGKAIDNHDKMKANIDE